jgi:hypothetical protein
MPPGRTTSAASSSEPEVTQGTDSLGRLYHKDPASGRFASKPKSVEEEGRDALELYNRASRKKD